MRVFNHNGHKINIVGIDSHELAGLDVVTAASLLDSNQGKVIGILNENVLERCCRNLDGQMDGCLCLSVFICSSDVRGG